MSKPLTFADMEILAQWGWDKCTRVLVEDAEGDIWYSGTNVPNQQEAWDIVSTCGEDTYWKFKCEDGAVFGLHFKRDHLGRPTLSSAYGPDREVGDILVRLLNW